MNDQIKFLETLCLVLLGLVVFRFYLMWAQDRRAAAITATGPQVHTTTASWVSSSLLHQRMADGTSYNNRNFTARVPKGKWPLGTWLLIESNGKKVCVKVTDWCGKDRIDLSEAAFAHLADLRQGIVGITAKTL